MTALLDRPVVAPERFELPPPVPHQDPRRPRRKPRRNGDLLWVAPLVLISAVVHLWGFWRAPQRFDDEGTYVAQAWAVQHWGELAHYTYWYDHPPLGWLQIAAWTTLTDGFDRIAPAVAAGREFMAVAHIASTILLWMLARRMGMQKVAAAGAVLIFSLSPLAVGFHRMVYLDNISTAWILAAFVLAAARHHQLAAFTASALCFAVAVLSKETSFLLLPPLAWWVWQNADVSTRRYTLTVAGSLLVLLGGGYLTFAILKGELVPGNDHVSLIDGVIFQLAERQPSGSVFDQHSQARDVITLWLQSDPVTPVLAVVAALPLLAVRRVRPIAAAYLLLVGLMLRPGYLPIPYVVAMLPFAALVIPAAIELAIRRGRLFGNAAAGVAIAGAVMAGPVWASGLNGLMTDDQDRPMAAAQAWFLEHVGKSNRLLVDDAVWVDLVRAGFPRDNVVWYFKADTDPEVKELAPRGWRDYDYLMVTESMRQSASLPAPAGGHAYPNLVDAFENSDVVAVFGEGPDRVEIRQVHNGDKARTARELACDRGACADARSKDAPAPTLPQGSSGVTNAPAPTAPSAPEPTTAPAPAPKPAEQPQGGLLDGLIDALSGGN